VPENSQEQVEAEYAREFPGIPMEDVAVLCDPCWEKFIAFHKTDSLNN
jgi:hypothetical protein